MFALVAAKKKAAEQVKKSKKLAISASNSTKRLSEKLGVSVEKNDSKRRPSPNHLSSKSQSEADSLQGSVNNLSDLGESLSRSIPDASVVLSAWFFKRGGKAGGASYQKRWFVLYSNGDLTYAKKPGLEIKGKINIVVATACEPHTNEIGKHCLFLTVPNRKFDFKFELAPERDQWCEKMIELWKSLKQNLSGTDLLKSKFYTLFISHVRSLGTIGHKESATIQLGEINKGGLYIIHFDTFYEIRKIVETKEFIVENEKILKDCVIPDRWEYSLSCIAPKPFKPVPESPQVIELPNATCHVDCEKCDSTGTRTCKLCSGKKDIPCMKCNEKGAYTCTCCNGRSIIHCRTCEGVGKNSCNNCKGSGISAGGQKCGLCGGEGTCKCGICEGKGGSDCNYCKSGMFSCEDCQGTGKNPCSKCSTIGSYMCKGCNGKKQYKVVKRMEVTWENLYDVDKTLQNCRIRRGHEMYKKVTENCPVETIVKQQDQLISQESMEKDFTFFPQFKQIPEEVIGKLKHLLTLSQPEGDDKLVKKILWQRYHIDILPIYTVKYTSEIKTSEVCDTFFVVGDGDEFHIVEYELPKSKVKVFGKAVA